MSSYTQGRGERYIPTLKQQLQLHFYNNCDITVINSSNVSCVLMLDGSVIALFDSLRVKNEAEPWDRKDN